MKKIVVLLAIGLLLSGAVFAMGGAPPSREVEIIEQVVTQTEESKVSENYEMSVLVEIPRGNKPGELGVKVVEGLAIVPERITVDGDGNLYIFDVANNRINKYDGAGRLVRSYKVDSFQLLSSGREDEVPLIIQNDIDVGVDDAGDIYVLNAKEKSVRKMNNDEKILIGKIPVPEKTNYIRTEKDGEVQAITYQGNKLEIYDISGQKTTLVKGFRTPGGLSVVLEEKRGLYEPQKISIFSNSGEQLKEIEINVPYRLYDVNYLGTDEENNLYILVKKQIDEYYTREIAPKKFKKIQIVDSFAYKYSGDDYRLMSETRLGKELWDEVRRGGKVSGSSLKSICLDKDGSIYLMIYFGDPIFNMKSDRIKVLKWKGLD